MPLSPAINRLQVVERSGPREVIRPMPVIHGSPMVVQYTNGRVVIHVTGAVTWIGVLLSSGGKGSREGR